MLSLFRKEIGNFFSSVTGYLVIVVFLLANSLFLWVFPGSFNIIDSGYASLEPLFIISPWVFLFLVSAVTMRMIAEEKRMGTLELLITRPLTEMQIILAKYFAAVLLVLLSLIPTLVFFVSVYLLGNPVGNVDTGGTWGSFIGLFFLAAIYAAIGIFSSSITDNQIVAFIIAVIISLFFYIGFDMLASLPLFAFKEGFVASLGINDHYKSISRGVLDSRDIIYFAGVVIIFLMFTKLKLQSRKW
jgi:ABC-2 type transport system permease protein